MSAKYDPVEFLKFVVEQGKNHKYSSKEIYYSDIYSAIKEIEAKIDNQKKEITRLHETQNFESYVNLPVDCDGEILHCRDAVYFKDESPEKIRYVCGYCMNSLGDLDVLINEDNGWAASTLTAPSLLKHIDTWERFLDDIKMLKEVDVNIINRLNNLLKADKGSGN